MLRLIKLIKTVNGPKTFKVKPQTDRSLFSPAKESLMNNTFRESRNTDVLILYSPPPDVIHNCQGKTALTIWSPGLSNAIIVCGSNVMHAAYLLLSRYNMLVCGPTSVYICSPRL